MSSDWRQWPGLADAVGGRLTVRRAAFGKANRARTDYRWLAASAGWVPAEERLERRLALGDEDRSVPCPLWRHESGQWLAVMCTRSRAHDFEGRPTPLEKHMLRCDAVPGVTPAMAAFRLFESVVKLSSDQWFDSYDQPQWQRADYQLQLDDGAAPALVAPQDDLETHVEEGIKHLLSVITEASLAQFFAQVLTGVRPALLRLTSEMPLEPFALAALLLPLEPKAYSFAGGIPSSIFPTGEEIQAWTGLVAQVDVQRVPTLAAVDSDALDRGRKMVAALLARDPGLLSAIHTAIAVAANGASVAGPVDAVTPPMIGEPAQAPARTTSDLANDQVAVGERSVVCERLARDDFFEFLRNPARHAMWPADINKDWRRSTPEFGFWEPAARALKETLLDPLEELERKTAANDVFERLRLDAEREECRMKADICRAWLIALVPRTELLSVVGRPRKSKDVGPLSFAVHFDAPRWRHCCNLSDELITDFIRDTRLGPKLTQRVEQWAREAGITS